MALALAFALALLRQQMSKAIEGVCFQSVPKCISIFIMTWNIKIDDDKKKHLREYYRKYNKEYYQNSSSMKKSRALYKLKQRVVIPDETLKTFGNNIPALLKLQDVLQMISPEVLYKYLALESKFDF